VKAGEDEAAALDTLTFIAGALDRLPEATASDAPNAERRSRDKGVLYNLLRRLIQDRPELGTAIQEVVDELNQDPDALDVFLSLQNYRLAFWRMASRAGYRRFSYQHADGTAHGGRACIPDPQTHHELIRRGCWTGCASPSRRRKS
jgi:hypothetical protein